ncbi:hypothetical protein ACLIIZ_02860 [Azonexus caeni]|jgi:hypothetical protein|uniref:hypothetical protein n=1 Tax=Azonexus caeni TaxID=266126 RepID=UPI003A85999A
MKSWFIDTSFAWLTDQRFVNGSWVLLAWSLVDNGDVPGNATDGLFHSGGDMAGADTDYVVVERGVSAALLQVFPDAGVDDFGGKVEFLTKFE